METERNARKTNLQIELDRIEAEARSKSYAIMNKADDLEAAHGLCALINSGGNCTLEQLEPRVIYTPLEGTCEIRVYARNFAEATFHKARSLGIAWYDNGESYKGVRDIRFQGFERIEVSIPEAEIAEYNSTLKAAA